jgi:hypothetical protein
MPMRQRVKNVEVQKIQQYHRAQERKSGAAKEGPPNETVEKPLSIKGVAG